MIKSDKNIYIQETEVKPNKYSIIVLRTALIGIVVCWIMREVGLFRVGALEMRIGSSITLITCGIPLYLLSKSEKRLENPKTKYLVMVFAIIYTATVGILLTFHTTIMLLFPIFIGMLYRSKDLGRFALIGSLSCTIFTPIIAYLIGTWDVPLFQELILIATGGNAEIVNPTYTFEFINILKILLYIVFPRLIMIGSCSILMFYVIQVSAEHVENQILLNQISHKDALTGLFNQNYYKEVIKSDFYWSSWCNLL